MKIRTGTDIIQISEIQELLRSSTKLAKMLNTDDTTANSQEHIAGRIALKEAVLKATSLKPGQWLDIHIRTDKRGKPILSFAQDIDNLESIDGSISHHGDYVLAVVTALYND